MELFHLALAETEDAGRGFNSPSLKVLQNRKDTRKKDKDKRISIWSGREI